MMTTKTKEKLLTEKDKQTSTTAKELSVEEARSQAMSIAIKSKSGMVPSKKLSSK